MFLSLTLISMAVAGLAVCWRNLQNDIPALANAVGKLPYVLKKGLRCGFCSTFWFSLVAVLLVEPLPCWDLPLRFAVSPEFYFVLRTFALWMMVGMYSVIIRFAYVVLQETVHYQVHHLRHKDHQH